MILNLLLKRQKLDKPADAQELILKHFCTIKTDMKTQLKMDRKRRLEN